MWRERWDGTRAGADWLARTRARETVPSQEVGQDIAEWRARRAGTLMRAHSGSALSASCGDGSAGHAPDQQTSGPLARSIGLREA